MYRLKRGQAWGFDVMMAATLFITGVVIFYLYTLNYDRGNQDSLDTLSYEANNVATTLLSEGYPINWTNNTVAKIGIITNDQIDQSKLTYFYFLSLQDYDLTRSLLNTRYDYFLNFSFPMVINGTSVPGIGLLPTNQENLVRVHRVAVHTNAPVTMYLYIWD